MALGWDTLVVTIPVTTQVPNLLRNNDLHSEHLKNGPEKPVSVGANHDI